MTKHLVCLYQRGRRGFHNVFKGERLFRSHERRNFPHQSLANRLPTHTDFYFLQGGLALSGVSRFLFLVFIRVDFVAVAFLTKWSNGPKFRILRPHRLQVRSENLELSCTKENPTWRTISLKTTPEHSFRFEGLKIFSYEEWLCLGRFPSWILKETPQSLQLSLALLSDITHYVARYDGSAPRVFVFAGSHCQRPLNKLIFIGYLLIFGNAVKRN